MITLDKYIGYEVTRATMMVLLILLTIISFITFTDELARVGKGGYETLHAFQFVLASIPALLYELFPPAALLGTLVGLGALAGNSEITAMRAAGISINQILLSVLKVGVMLMLLTFVIGEYIAPASQTYAETMRSLAMNQGRAFKTANALWVKEGDSFVRISEIKPGGRLGALQIYEFDGEHHLKRVTRSENAFFRGRDEWMLFNVSHQLISEDGIALTYTRQESWQSLLSPDLLNMVLVKPETMSAWNLYRYASYLEDNGVDAGQYIQAFWDKVISPFSTAIMVLLGVPFIFGSLRSSSAGHRILTGVVVGVGFHIFGQVFHYSGLVFEIPPLLAASLPSVLFLIVAVLLLRRIR